MIGVHQSLFKHPSVGLPTVAVGNRYSLVVLSSSVKAVARTTEFLFGRNCPFSAKKAQNKAITVNEKLLTLKEGNFFRSG